MGAGVDGGRGGVLGRNVGLGLWSILKEWYEWVRGDALSALGDATAVRRCSADANTPTSRIDTWLALRVLE